MSCQYLLYICVANPCYSVLLDDTDTTGRLGGGAYRRFGIDQNTTTLVIIRPDGYVGMIAPASALEDVNSYFSAFMIPLKV